MAFLVGHFPMAVVGALTDIHTAIKNPLGSRAFDSDGNEFVYLQGIASTVQYDWVTFNEASLTARLVANAVGPVAVAQAAIVASSYGFYAINGLTSGNSDTIAADQACYIDGTTGRVDDSAVAGDLVVGAYSQTADTANVATFRVVYPGVTNVLG